MSSIKNPFFAEDPLEGMGDSDGNDTPLRLRPMDTAVVAAFVRRAIDLANDIGALTRIGGNEELRYAAWTMRAEAQQFGEPWERTPHMAMRLVKAIRPLAEKLRAAAEMQIAEVADGLALDIEAAIQPKERTEHGNRNA